MCWYIGEDKIVDLLKRKEQLERRTVQIANNFSFLIELSQKGLIEKEAFALAANELREQHRVNNPDDTKSLHWMKTMIEGAL